MTKEKKSKWKNFTFLRPVFFFNGLSTNYLPIDTWFGRVWLVLKWQYQVLLVDFLVGYHMVIRLRLEVRIEDECWTDFCFLKAVVDNGFLTVPFDLSASLKPFSGSLINASCFGSYLYHQFLAKSQTLDNSQT